MSQLVAKILLAILMFPLASLWYAVVVVVLYEGRYRGLWQNRDLPWVFAGVSTWILMAIYWALIWKSSVRWTSERMIWTFGCALGALLFGTVAGSLLNSIERDFGTFVGTASAPLLWIVSTCFIWRENREERTERLRAVNENTLVCPNCGYNLTGLSESRCPECGEKFTLNELVAAQPKRAMTEVE